MIEPLEELLPSVLVQIPRGPPIKVRVEFVNDAAVTLDGQETDLEGVSEEEEEAVEDGTHPDE